MLKTIEWKNGCLKFLDQTKLPAEEVYQETADFREVAQAIKRLSIRGAPLIGVSAAYALCLGAQEAEKRFPENYFDFLDQVDNALRHTRPTAVNLFWALDRMGEVWSKGKLKGESIQTINLQLIREAQAIENEDREINQTIARLGSQLIQTGETILTHCNAGALACGAWGTALGAIYWASVKDNKKISVLADETRPLLQGARLTTFELLKNRVPTTLICDNMAGFFMAQGKVDRVIVGADRIALNGDVANKIGTYSLAVLAFHHSIPFHVAAPLSTVDDKIFTGEEIPIEERGKEEVICWGERQIAPFEVGVRNPAFDVTPNQLITSIITEKGILYPPFTDKLKKLKKGDG